MAAAKAACTSAKPQKSAWRASLKQQLLSAACSKNMQYTENTVRVAKAHSSASTSAASSVTYAAVPMAAAHRMVHVWHSSRFTAYSMPR